MVSADGERRGEPKAVPTTNRSIEGSERIQGREAELATYYRRLLDLDEPGPLEPLVEDVLEKLVELVGANIGYLELPRGPLAAPLRCGIPRGDLAGLRRLISQGIIMSAIEGGRTIRTACALDDDRFSDLGSVRFNQIRRAVCAPIDIPPARGVIYLQGTGPGMPLPMAGEQAELFARQLKQRLGRVPDITRSRKLGEATLAFRRSLALQVLTEMDGNVAAAARVLGIDRSTLYDIVPELGRRRAAANDQGIPS